MPSIIRFAWAVTTTLGVSAAAIACGDPETIDIPVFDSGVRDSGMRDGGADTGPIDSGVEPTVIIGAPDRILLRGTVVTPETVVDGEVLIEGSVITCVGTTATCDAKMGAQGATVIETHGIIAPGLIDTHNHILFDIFDDSDWLPAKSYTNHADWTTEPKYQAMLDVKQCLANDSQGKPVWCDQTPYGNAAGSLKCEMDKYGELKGLVSGTTSIVGLPGTSAACFGSLARSIDVSQNGIGSDHVQTSALFPPSKSSADGVCAAFASLKTEAYLIHCGEGTDAKALAEFTTLGSVSTTPECLYAPQTALTHGTSFTKAEFDVMAAKGMKLIWSPHSNVSLYGATADIPTALTSGVAVSLAPDWSMGGSRNMLEELRFAKNWSDTKWAGRLSAKDLLVMSTVNPAKVLSLSDTIGSLKQGLLADIVVYAGDATKPYDAIVGAREGDVRLVMIGGTVLFGDKVLEKAAPAAPGCETLDSCGRPKFLCAATTNTTSKLDQTYATIKKSLEDALVAADALTPNDGWNFAPLTPLVGCK